MHELALMESLVESVGAQAGQARVLTVRLEVGRLTCVVPDALRFCFDVCTRGTPLEGAELDIVEIPGWARCRACARQVEVEGIPACACGSFDLELMRGQELTIREVEVV